MSKMKKQFWKLFLLIFLSAFVVCATALVALYIREKNHQMEELVQDSQFYLKRQGTIIEKTLNEIYSDAVFLKHLSSLSTALVAPTPDTFNEAKEDLTAFSQNHSIYEQIQVLSPSGMEKFVIVWDGTTSYEKPQDLLASEASSSEFKKVLSLPGETIYQFPVKSLAGNQMVLKVGTKFLNGSGELIGVLLITYNADLLLDALARAPRPYPETVFAIFNQQGQALSLSPYSLRLSQILSTDIKEFESPVQQLKEGTVVIVPYVFRNMFDTAHAPIPLRRNWSLTNIEFANPSIKLIAYTPQNTLVHNFQQINALFIGALLAIALTLILLSYVIAQHISRAHLQTLSKNKKVFLGNIAHELKSPLGNLLNTLDLLSDSVTSEENQELIQIGKRNIRNLNKSILLLQKLSSVESGKQAVKKEEIDLTTLINDCAQAESAEIKKRGITLQTHVPTDLPPFHSDPFLLSSILSSLLSNAVKYNFKEGKIDITVSFKEPMMRFKVSNTGPCLIPGQCELIFNKYETIGEEAQKGTGLGLSLVKEFVELLGGHVWVDCNSEHPTTFIFEIPRE